MCSLIFDSSNATIFSNTGAQWLENMAERKGYPLKLLVTVNLQPKVGKSRKYVNTFLLLNIKILQY